MCNNDARDMSDTERATLDEIVAAARAHPGLRAKGPIALVAEVFGASDWEAGPATTGAVVEVGGRPAPRWSSAAKPCCPPS